MMINAASSAPLPAEPWEELLPAVAERYGSPLFLYDERRLERDYFSLRDALPREVVLYYSMKANPNPAICRRIHDWGSPVEVASIGEYDAARAAGVRPETIVFTGPGKSGEEILRVLRHGIYAINAESAFELLVIQEQALRLGKEAPVTLRVNLDVGRPGSRMASVGVSSQFGIDEAELDDAVRLALSLDGVKLLGLHTYQGTQNFHLDFYRESIPRTFALVRRLQAEYALKLECVGLGGGFGVPSFEGDEEFPVRAFGALLAEQAKANEDLGLNRLFVESGRRIAASMGLYVTKVLYAKRSRGKDYLIVDGGTHHRAFDSVMGRSFKRPLPILAWKRAEGRGYESGAGDGRVAYQICGKLCTPTDVIRSGTELPKLEPGDLIGFPDAGAYGLTCGNVHFLSHELPREIMRTKEGGFADISWL
ncbi:diaminopimelate decarboxylase [Cohnella xylanilytica]|uniref:Alanine racemase n=1 Tax=Cohnella xylanilytica TaxID=557555 RepID=A0A841TZ31_9BACL|nr:alanine racemase [Cohnella xylanilytica]MBB6690914.1 alanine racemase [Cohnella xylanilytica]GIO13736.1 diaminopimelate decarboxylase [Cohnella xylanilytica]